MSHSAWYLGVCYAVALVLLLMLADWLAGDEEPNDGGDDEPPTFIG